MLRANKPSISGQNRPSHTTKIRLPNPKNFPNRQSIRQPATIKYLLRPTIKGPSRANRNFSTMINKPKDNIMNFSVAHFFKNGSLYSNNLLHTIRIPKRFMLTNPKDNISAIDKNANKKEISIGQTNNSIDQNAGLGHFLKRVYFSTGLGCSGFLATSLLFSPFMTSPEMAISSIIVGTIGMFSSIYFFEKEPVNYETRTIEIFDKKITTKVAVYNDKKYLSSVALCTSMGLMMSPVLMMTGPVLALEAAGISLAVMTGAALYARSTKPGSLLPYRSVAYGALTGLIGVGLTSIGSALLFGHNNFFYLLNSIDIYGGIALFTAMTAIDTQKAIEMYKDDEPDHLTCSIGMVMNMANIFIRVLKILSKLKND